MKLINSLKTELNFKEPKMSTDTFLFEVESFELVGSKQPSKQRQ